MSISTYAELKSSIADFLNRDDLTSVIPTFISLAEAEMNRKIRHWRLEERTTIGASGQYTAIPSDFVAPIRLSLDTDSVALELINSQEMQEARQSANDVAGKPRYYALSKGEIELFPTPNGTYTVDLTYRKKIDALSDSNTTNVILDNFPDAYLYGALMHSAPYLADDGRVAVWGNLYAQAMEAILRDNSDAKFGASGIRMKLASF